MRNNALQCQIASISIELPATPSKYGIRDAFYVDEPWWKAAVYGRFVDMTLRAGRRLHAMTTA
jgi:hypothetical protein